MLPQFLVHTVTVESFTGPTPTGDGYSAPLAVVGLLDDGVVRVQGPTGEQLVQQTKFYCPLAFTVSGVEYVAAAVFTPESRVTANGRACQVTKTHRREAGAMFASMSHLEVDLT